MKSSEIFIFSGKWGRKLEKMQKNPSSSAKGEPDCVSHIPQIEDCMQLLSSFHPKGNILQNLNAFKTQSAPFV